MSRYRPPKSPEGLVWCSRGRHYQPREEFYVQSSYPRLKSGEATPSGWCKACTRDYMARRRERMRLDRRLAAALAAEPPEPPCAISGEICVIGPDGQCPCERVIGGDTR